MTDAGNIKRMKLFILSGVFHLSLVLASAQKPTETESIYIVALEKYVMEIDSFYRKHSDGTEKYRPIFLERTDLIQNLPSDILGVEVVELGDNWKEIYRKNGNRLTHLKIFPIEIEEGLIKVTLAPYHGELKKRNNLQLGFSDWTSVYFEYDCSKRLWVYDRTENDGI